MDLGVQQLKEIAYERAIEGQLSPVFVGGKLKGFRRVRNDRLLMFCLRMNARDERGQRLSASYFDAGNDALSGQMSGQSFSITAPALSRAEKDDMNAAMIEHFDPVAMSLPEIEAMQAQLAEIAHRKRAEEDGPVDHDRDADFVELRSADFKPAGELESLEGVEDELNNGTRTRTTGETSATTPHRETTHEQTPTGRTPPPRGIPQSEEPGSELAGLRGAGRGRRRREQGDLGGAGAQRRLAQAIAQQLPS